MKKIQILGSGCKNCETTAKLIEIAADEIGIEIELEKITDIAEIMSHGIMSTPGVIIDGRVVHAGGLPAPEQIRSWLAESEKR